MVTKTYPRLRFRNGRYKKDSDGNDLRDERGYKILNMDASDEEKRPDDKITKALVSELLPNFVPESLRNLGKLLIKQVGEVVKYKNWFLERIYLPFVTGNDRPEEDHLTSCEINRS